MPAPTREDPLLDVDRIAACLRDAYGIDPETISFLPIGYDLGAAVYSVAEADGAHYFLKVRFGPLFEPGLRVPRALANRGISNILAPLPAQDGSFWQPAGGDQQHSIILYPFIDGENAKVAGLSAEQWRVFGRTLRTVHDSGLERDSRSTLRFEDFTLPSASLVYEMRQIVTANTFIHCPAAAGFAAFWRAREARIDVMLDRAAALGSTLRERAFERVLCHGDIHAANILTTANGAIWLIDWDAPLIAPRERDFLFVIGSRLARDVLPHEEAWFFEGYGPVQIDPEALIYFRYERTIEDFGDIAARVLLDTAVSEEFRQDEAVLAMSFFDAGGEVERAEEVVLPPGVRSRSPSECADPHQGEC